MQRGYLCRPTVSREDLVFAQTPLNKETRKLSLLKLEKMKSKTEPWNLISFGIAFHWLCKQPKKFTLSVINPFIHNRGGFKGEGARGVRPPFLFFFAITCLFYNHFEELQTVLFKVELVISNALLTCVYPHTIETCLTPNHLLFRRQLLYSSNTTSTVFRNLTVLSSTTDK